MNAEHQPYKHESITLRRGVISTFDYPPNLPAIDLGGNAKVLKAGRIQPAEPWPIT